MSDFDFDIIRRSWPLMREATWVSIQVFAWSLVLASFIGLLFALMRLSNVRALRWIAGTYVWIFRGLPALVILFFAFFWVGRVLDLTSFQAAILGLGVSSGAYKAEIIRAGILAVDNGQREASDALAMTRAQSMRRIILPQGIRVMIPNYVSNSTLLFKSTSLATVIGLNELTGKSRQLANSTFKPIEILTAAGVIYLVLTSVLVGAQVLLERRYAVKA
ncbi:MAG: His/Glu/Gln/Arg/opine family amino acid ABC transporter permease subunit [Ilumatobacter sp.]|jgi:His/Glu/Gln/Arg/opine family amino acid ABC transporter permease subunit